jgi:hypothetical protein
VALLKGDPEARAAYVEHKRKALAKSADVRKAEARRKAASNQAEAK